MKGNYYERMIKPVQQKKKRDAVISLSQSGRRHVHRYDFVSSGITRRVIINNKLERKIEEILKK